MESNKTCCFFGHRKLEDCTAVIIKLFDIIEDLIIKENVDTFLFGSRSEFDTICLNIVKALKNRYPHIKRIYIRAEYPEISDDYRYYLLKSYDKTYFPEELKSAGKSIYIQRNYIMIEKSDICVTYCKDDYKPIIKNYKSGQIKSKKSGTKIAYDYADKKTKK